MVMAWSVDCGLWREEDVDRAFGGKKNRQILSSICNLAGRNRQKLTGRNRQ